MKTIATIALAILLTGCGKGLTDQEQKQINENYIQKVIQQIINEAPIITRDNCEYLMFYNGHCGYIATHKGDCKNPIHIYNKLPQTGK